MKRWALALLSTLGAAGAARGEDARPLPGRLAGARLEAAEAASLDARIARLAEPVARSNAATLRADRVALANQGWRPLLRLAPLLRDPARPTALREQLVRVLAAIDEPEARALLLEQAAAPEPSIRARVTDGLARDPETDALGALARLARDPWPGVRAAALRALFAREDGAARLARTALPQDPDPALFERRLTLHRLRGDASPPLRTLALEAWRTGRLAPVRLAAARLLASPALGTATPDLLAIVDEMGPGSTARLAFRWAAGTPTEGYDPVEERWAAIEAARTALARADLPAAARAVLLDLDVGWLAQPVPMDPRLPDPIPEQELMKALPDLGAEILPAFERRFLPGGFRAPRDGARLLAELEPDVALPPLQRLLAADQPQPVRAAASGALRVLGEIPDRALAERLLAPEEEASIRRDAIGALAQSAAPWAVGLLVGLLDAPDRETVDAALDALEERNEPAARAAYERHVLDGKVPEQQAPARLARLLVRWDDGARATFAAALASPHGELRAAALSLAARFPLARLTEVLPALEAREPVLQGAREVEAWIPALLRARASKGLAYVRTRWTDFPVGESLASTRCRALAALDLVRRGDEAAAAVDLLLERAADATDTAVIAHALEALAGRRGHRDAEIDALFARLLAGEGLADDADAREYLAASVVQALAAPGRGDLTARLLPMLAELAPDEERTHRTVAVLRALEHQPWAAVEAPVLELALDARLPDVVRAQAGWLLAGRAGPAARARIATQLVEQRQGDAEPSVLLALAAAAGTGADAAWAERFVAALEEEVRAFHAQEPPPDPLAPRLDALPQRVQALAAAAAYAGQGPHVERLVRLLFEARYVGWAERVLEINRLSHVTPDALASLAPAVSPAGARLETGEEEGSLLPPEVAQVALGLKGLGDEALARALTTVLADPEVARTLDRFPDAWPAKLAALLRDPQSGELRQSAARLEARVLRLEPHDGPFDLEALRSRLAGLLEARRWAEAADTSHAVRRLAALRGDELHGGAAGSWQRARTAERIWRACAAHDEAALAASVAEAEDALAALLTAASAAADAGLALEAAEGWAWRALALERRAEGEAGRVTHGVLARVLLARGRPGEAARLLDPALGERVRPGQGRLHLLLARAFAQHGDAAAARTALRRALLAEPSLAAGLETDAAFEPMRADGSLATLLLEVEAERRSP